MKINEVSKLYDISADTLRYYERIGLIPPVTRNESGIRDYSESDCNWVKFANARSTQGASYRGARQARGAYGADAGNARQAELEN